jgi:hypothetical protein
MRKQEKVQVKVFLIPGELRLLRLAAANRCISASAFLKQSGLVAAAKEMEDFSPPRLEVNSSPPQQPHRSARSRKNHKSREDR